MGKKKSVLKAKCCWLDQVDGQGEGDGGQGVLTKYQTCTEMWKRVKSVQPGDVAGCTISSGKKKKKNYFALVTYLTICVYTEGVYTHFYHSIGFFLLKFRLGFFPWEGWGREGSNFSNFHWQSMPAWDVLCVLCLSVCLLWGPNTITDVWWCPLSATQDTLSPCVQTPFKGKLE